MGKMNPWIQRRRTPAEDAAEVEKYLAQGGKVTKLREGSDSSYDKNVKSGEKNLIGGFSIFTKEESLTVDE
jgi:hypothetical protein